MIRREVLLQRTVRLERLRAHQASDLPELIDLRQARVGGELRGGNLWNLRRRRSPGALDHLPRLLVASAIAAAGPGLRPAADEVRPSARRLRKPDDARRRTLRRRRRRRAETTERKRRRGARLGRLGRRGPRAHRVARRGSVAVPRRGDEVPSRRVRPRHRGEDDDASGRPPERRRRRVFWSRIRRRRGRLPRPSPARARRGAARGDRRAGLSARADARALAREAARAVLPGELSPAGVAPGAVGEDGGARRRARGGGGDGARGADGADGVARGDVARRARDGARLEREPRGAEPESGSGSKRSRRERERAEDLGGEDAEERGVRSRVGRERRRQIGPEMERRALGRHRERVLLLGRRRRRRRPTPWWRSKTRSRRRRT
mmetsp:Transcript_14021/g.50369  ORF Transcript_14021/g.50369 Transcript_14021/m.50369 type:complete len:379 (-) Transcript_14021:1002-2138(-)